MVALADSANLLLASWQNFYVMVGSSAGALIGLQFVVITLVAGTRQRASMETVNAFGSPIVVQFGAALAISGIMVAPWNSVHSISIALALCGIAGIIYSIIVLRRTRRQTGYEPVLEDWIWFVTAPFVTYASLSIAAALVWADTGMGLLIAAGATLALLLIGLRNAWDTVTHLASSGSGAQPGESKKDDNG